MVIFMYSVLNIENTITIEKSKFITSLFYIENEQDITKYMNLVKEKYKNATHYCYAYIIGNIKRFSDDKEPSNTAGMPILNCLEKNNLNHILCIVTRYFGGTLLGAGGLIRAYSHASKIAIDAGHIITMAPCKVISVSVDYSFYDRLNILLNEFSANIENSEFTDSVTVIFSIRENTVSLLQDKLTQLSNGKYLLKEIGEKFAKVE